MRITKSQLQQLIQEELSSSELDEADSSQAAADTTAYIKNFLTEFRGVFDSTEWSGAIANVRTASQRSRRHRPDIYEEIRRIYKLANALEDAVDGLQE